MNSNEKFTKWYKGFLKSSNESLSEETAETEAELVKEHIDCSAYVDITEAEHCVFCKDENNIGQADYYALTDVARERDELCASKLGGRRDAHILPLVLPICKRCRRNFFLAHIMPSLICTVLIITVLVLSTSSEVKEMLYSADILIPATMRPFFFFVTATAFIVLICTALGKILSTKLKTTFNLLNIKGLSFLADNGWKRLYKNRQFKVIFSQSRPEYMHSEAQDTADSQSIENSEESTADNEEQ